MYRPPIVRFYGLTFGGHIKMRFACSFSFVIKSLVILGKNVIIALC